MQIIDNVSTLEAHAVFIGHVITLGGGLSFSNAKSVFIFFMQLLIFSSNTKFLKCGSTAGENKTLLLVLLRACFFYGMSLLTRMYASPHPRKSICGALTFGAEDLGDLDRVKRIVKLVGFVNCTDGFTGQPKVVNGASDLFAEVNFLTLFWIINCSTYILLRPRVVPRLRVLFERRLSCLFFLISIYSFN